MKRKHVKAIALLTAGAMALLATGCGDAGSGPAPESKQEETGGEAPAEEPGDAADEDAAGEDASKEDASSEEGESAEPADGTQAEADYTFPLAEPIEITALSADFGRDKTQWADEQYEKYTNVKIDWTLAPTSDVWTVVNLKLNSGELPDMILVNKTLVDQFAGEGLFVDFMDYLDRMPNLRAWMEKIPAIYYDTVDAEGHLYCLTNFNTRGQAPIMSLYRKDIFEKENIPVPATIDELYDALVTLKAKYPDSIPISNRWGASNLIGVVGNLYQCTSGFYLDADTGNYEYGAMTDKFKAAIATLQKFYAADLIDPEFATVSDDQYIDRVVSGKVFFWFGEYTGALYTESKGDWVGNGKKNNPDFEIDAMPFVETEIGQGQSWVQAPTGRGAWSTAVSAQSEHIDEIMALIDYQLSQELIDLVNWGVEGETYEVADGQKKWLIEPEERTERGLDARTGMWIPIDQDCYDASLNDRSREIIWDANARLKAEDFGRYDPKKAILFTDEEQERKSEIMTPIKTYMEEELMNFITGKKNMDGDWEAFKQQITDMGYEEILEMYRDKYNALPEDQKGFDKDLGL